MALSASVYASDTAFPILMSRQEAAFPKYRVSFHCRRKAERQVGCRQWRGKTVIPITYDKIALSLSDEEIRAADLASEDDRADLIEVKQKISAVLRQKR